MSSTRAQKRRAPIAVRSSTIHDKRSQKDSLDVNDPKFHREHRRLIQIRYRNKVRNYGSHLEEDVCLLREEVEKLEMQYQSLASRSIADMTPWNVVAEYYRLFRYGFTAFVPLSERCNKFNLVDVFESRTQRDFLLTMMAPNVLFDGLNGVEAMIERWRFISISQPNFDAQVVRLELGPDGSIVATIKIRIVMCESMLDHTFPNLANSGRGRVLAAKLVGQRFEIDGSSHFRWDSEKRRLQSVDNKSDPFTPILRVLGNLEDVSFVFDEEFASLEGRQALTPCV